VCQLQKWKVLLLNGEKLNKKSLNFDLFLIFLWPIIIGLISFWMKPNALYSIILFLLIPAIYLSFKGTEFVKKSLLFSVIIAIPTMIVIDYIAQMNQTWLMYSSSILPFKFFGIVTFEVVLWAVALIYLIVMFYEYFLDRHFTKKLYTEKLKYLLIILLVFFSLFVFRFYEGSIFRIPYFYLFWGILLLFIPVVLQSIKHFQTTAKFFLALAYFFYLDFIYEITAIKLGWWSFPGREFIGWVTIMNIRFPIEELFFWMILFTLGVLTYFEYFDDDEK